MAFPQDEDFKESANHHKMPLSTLGSAQGGTQDNPVLREDAPRGLGRDPSPVLVNSAFGHSLPQLNAQLDLSDDVVMQWMQARTAPSNSVRSRSGTPTFRASQTPTPNPRGFSTGVTHRALPAMFDPSYPASLEEVPPYMLRHLVSQSPGAPQQHHRSGLGQASPLPTTPHSASSNGPGRPVPSQNAASRVSVKVEPRSPRPMHSFPPRLQPPNRVANPVGHRYVASQHVVGVKDSSAASAASASTPEDQPVRRRRYKEKEAEQIRVIERERDESTNLFFASFTEAVSRVPPVSWQLPQDDDTVPTTDAEKQEWVRRLVEAFANIEDIEDKTTGPVITSRWLGYNGEKPDYYHEQIIELVCWEILTMTIKMYKDGLGWVPIYDQETWRKSEREKHLTFEQRMEALIALFSAFKNRCDKMIKGENIHVTILTPVEAKKTAKNNRSANDDRQATLKEGRKLQESSGNDANEARPRKKRRVYRKNKVTAPATQVNKHDSEEDGEYEIDDQPLEVPLEAPLEVARDAAGTTATSATPAQTPAAQQSQSRAAGGNGVPEAMSEQVQDSAGPRLSDLAGFNPRFDFESSKPNDGTLEPGIFGNGTYGGLDIDSFGLDLTFPLVEQSATASVPSPYHLRRNSVSSASQVYSRESQEHSQAEPEELTYETMAQPASQGAFEHAPAYYDPHGHPTFGADFNNDFGQYQM